MRRAAALARQEAAQSRRRGLARAMLPRPAVQRSLDSLFGRVLGGKYQLVSFLGHGAFGEVYRARELGHGRSVALKILGLRWREDGRLIERFAREARASSRLHHPNTVSVFDAGETEDGIPFIAMELLAGQTLRRVLRAGGCRTMRSAVSLMSQVLSGLQCAHEAGVVHGDLKPENVIVQPMPGGLARVKLIDFGSVHIPGDDARAGDGLICGTPRYMAPELVTGQSPTAMSDLYAAGTLLYELLTGRPPFSGKDSLGVLYKQVHEEPIPAVSRAPQRAVDPRLSAIAQRALSKSPWERYQGAASMRSALLDAIRRRDHPLFSRGLKAGEDAGPACASTVQLALGSGGRGAPG